MPVDTPEAPRPLQETPEQQLESAARALWGSLVFLGQEGPWRRATSWDAASQEERDNLKRRVLCAGLDRVWSDIEKAEEIIKKRIYTELGGE